MRILMTTDTVGGVWTYTRELVEGLLAAGDEVVLVSMGRAPSPDQEHWAEHIASRYASAFRYIPIKAKLEWMQDNSSCYSDSCDLLLSLADAFRPDVFHTNQFCHGKLPAKTPKVLVAHSDVLSWHECCRPAAHNHQHSALDQKDSEARRRDPDPWLDRYLSLVREGIAGASAVVAPTYWMLRSLERNYGPLRQSTVIPNGRSIPALCTVKKQQAITAGRVWDEAKNIRMLENVQSPMPLFIAGDVEMCGEARFQSSQLNLLGPLAEADLLRLMSESAIYIATSRYEPFGLAPLEAALSHCAIVANDIPSLREVWGDAAVYFNGAKALSNILRELAGNPSLVRKMAGDAFKHAVSHYTREAMTERYRHLYRSLLDQTPITPGADHASLNLAPLNHLALVPASISYDHTSINEEEAAQHAG